MRKVNSRGVQAGSLADERGLPGLALARRGLAGIEIGDHLVQFGPGTKLPRRVRRRTGPAATGEAAGRREPIAVNLDLQERDAGLRKGQVVIAVRSRPQNKV